MDADAFCAHLATDAELHFGNLPPVKGVTAINEFVSGFFASIRALRHEVIEHWLCDDGTVVCRGVVSYFRHDGSTFCAPFANIIKVINNHATDYRVFADLSPLSS
jgi:hypothetical protein